MPSPPSLTTFQNLLFARQLLRDPRRPIEECTARFGPIWQSMVPGSRGLKLVPLTWMMGREGNERVLSPKHKDDFSWYEGYSFTMEPLFGPDILLLLDDAVGDRAEADRDRDRKDDRHRQRQHLLAPAFHPRLDPDYQGAMASIVEQHLDALPLDAPVDVQWLVKKLTFHIIARLLMGVHESDLLELTHLFEQVGMGLFSVVHLSVPGLPFHRAKKARAALERYLSERLAACRSGEQAAPPMLASMLAAQELEPALTDQIIIAELISFMYAGYDTTSSLLTSLIVALGDAENRAIYTELRDRLRATAATDPGGSSCAYLDAVMMESERLYPPLLFLMRGVRRDFTFAGCDIKQGSKVTYSPYYTGRIPELYPEPLRFNPQRFLDENGELRRVPPYTLLGFGGGHRMCIGKRLAGIEMRLFVTRLLRRFDLDFFPQKSDALYFNPALQRRHGYHVRLAAA